MKRLRGPAFAKSSTPKVPAVLPHDQAFRKSKYNLWWVCGIVFCIHKFLWWSMEKLPTTIFTTFVLLFCIACNGRGRPITTRYDTLRKTQELFDAVASGNKQPWRKYISDDVMYFDEQGHSMDKTTLLASIEPLPAGVSGTIRIVNSKFNLQGQTLIHSYDMEERENVHGQELHARYHATDTWMKRKRDWQIVAGQVLRYYEDPTPGVVDARKFRDYIGTYDLAGQSEVVSWEDNKLYLTRGTHVRVELIPEACDIFFRRGAEGRVLFHYVDGNVISLIDRRNNEDIVWKRVR